METFRAGHLYLQRILVGYPEFVQLIYERVEPDTELENGYEPVSLPRVRSTTVDRKQRNDDSALRIACEDGDFKSVKALLESTDDINIPDAKGDTPLMSAAAFGYIEIVKLLLSKGVWVDQQRDDGITALHQACVRGQVDVVRSLLENGARVDFADAMGWTPFMHSLKSEAHCFPLMALLL